MAVLTPNGLMVADGSPSGGFQKVKDISTLTTQYRMTFVNSSGVITESSSIVTDASGNLGVGRVPVYVLDAQGGDGNGFRYTGASSVGVQVGVSSTLGQIGTTTGHALEFLVASTARATIDTGGRFLIGTSTAGASKLRVNDDSIEIMTAKTPASAGATGTTGQIAWDSSYFYVCVATDTWQRVAHATW